MKKREKTVIRDSNFEMKKRITEALLKLRKEKIIKHVQYQGPLIKDLFVFLVTYQNGFITSFDFFVNEDRDKAGFAFSDTSRVAFNIHSELNDEEISRMINVFIARHDVGIENDASFVRLANNALKKYGVKNLRLEPSTFAEDINLKIDCWLIASVNGSTEKFPIQLKLSASGMKKIDYKNNELIFITFDFRKPCSDKLLAKSFQQIAYEGLKEILLVSQQTMALTS